ncbi:MAG TPA: thioredoxin family protein [Candidatus Polarisedimenticolia bacterium]|nr:thioredoxin family protein [Candidatus Polarisedimenticolia bacterium]
MKTPSTWLRSVALAAICAAPIAALSNPALADTITCRAVYDFCVEVDGKYPQDARFFTAPDSRGKHMIDIPSQSVSYLIDMPARKAVSIPRANVRPDGDGVVKVDTSVASNAASYALSIEGPVLRFQTGNAKVRILKVLDRPPVIGEVGMDALIADRIEYREGIKRYTPDKVAMDAIKAWKKPMEIEAYFATWCAHCKMYMPKVLRVLKDAGNPNIKVALVGVPKNFGMEKGPWEGKGLQGIPVIIVKSEGREVTRLGTHEGAVPEVELAGIMSALK